MIKVRSGTSIKDYLIHGIFLTFYGFFKYLPPPIGDLFRYVFLKLFIKKLGNCRVRDGVTIYYPYNIEIGNDVTLNEFVYISGYGGVKIGNGVRIGSSTTIISSDHEFRSLNVFVKDQNLIPGRVVIEENVWIGTNVTILRGVTVGKNAIIAACALVNKDIPSNTIVAGVPAKIIKVRE